MPAPRPITGWAIVYNTSIQQSYTDALWYCSQRNLPINLIGVAFGTNPPVGGQNDLVDGTYTLVAGKTYVNGSVVTSWDGQTVVTGCTNYMNATGINGILASTYTQAVKFQRLNGALLTPVIGELSAEMTGGIGPTPNQLYCGRLGCPQLTVGFAIDSSKELVTRSGLNAMQSAVAAALQAEKQNYASKPHWMTNSLQYSGHVSPSQNGQILTQARQFGFTTVNLGTNAGADVDYTSWFGGTSSPVQELFALVMGNSDFNADATYGQHGYSNNYRASVGAWCFTWTSYAWEFCADLIYNGGAGGISTFSEPLADGLRDPIALFKNIVNYKCPLAVAVDSNVTDQSAPGFLLNGFDAFNTIAIGDPLYSPYLYAQTDTGITDKERKRRIKVGRALEAKRQAEGGNQIAIERSLKAARVEQAKAQKALKEAIKANQRDEAKVLEIYEREIKAQIQALTKALQPMFEKPADPLDELLKATKARLLAPKRLIRDENGKIVGIH